MPDFECTLFPDIWFGMSLTDCCIAHDLGGTDAALALCVVEVSPSLIPVAIVMYTGLRTLGVLYRKAKGIKIYGNHSLAG